MPLYTTQGIFGYRGILVDNLRNAHCAVVGPLVDGGEANNSSSSLVVDQIIPASKYVPPSCQLHLCNTDNTFQKLLQFNILSQELHNSLPNVGRKRC